MIWLQVASVDEVRQQEQDRRSPRISPGTYPFVGKAFETSSGGVRETKDTTTWPIVFMPRS